MNVTVRYETMQQDSSANSKSDWWHSTRSWSEKRVLGTMLLLLLLLIRLQTSLQTWTICLRYERALYESFCRRCLAALACASNRSAAAIFSAAAATSRAVDLSKAITLVIFTKSHTLMGLA